MKSFGKSVVLPCVAVSLMLLSYAGTAAAAPGDPDPGFGLDGEVTFAVGAAKGQLARGSAIQEDGRIVVAGTSVPTGTGLVARYEADGKTLDPDFGVNGAVEIAGRVWDSVAVQDDGGIILAGRTGTLATITRLLPNGTVDGAFATSGNYTGSVEYRDPGEGGPKLKPHLSTLVILDSGEIMAGGSVFDCQGSGGACGPVAAIRLTAAGEPAADFGENDGIRFFDAHNFGAVGFMPGGQTVIVSTTEEETVDEGYESVTQVEQHAAHFVVPTPDEYVEPSDEEWYQSIYGFGAYGGTAFPGNGTGAVVPGPEGKDIFVASGSLILRLTDRGFTRKGDPFGQQGQVDVSTDALKLNLPGSGISIGDLKFDDAGRLIVSGSTAHGKKGGSFLLRLNPDGSPDPTFSNDGIATIWTRTDRNLPKVGTNPLPRVLIRDGGYAVAGSFLNRSGQPRFGIGAFAGGDGQPATCKGLDATYIGDDDDEVIDVVGGVVAAAGGDDKVTFGGTGPNAVVCGGDGDDRISVVGATALGQGGNDTITGLKPSKKFRVRTAETLIGGTGDDNLIGFGGSDHLAGGSGADVLFGGDEDDDLFGGGGRDRLSGGRGIDRLSGGAGRDKLDGGPTDPPRTTYASESDDATVEMIQAGNRITETTIRTGYYCNQTNPGSTGEYTPTFRIDKDLKFKGRRQTLSYKVQYSSDWDASDERFIARKRGRTITGRYMQTMPSPWWATCWTGESLKDPWIDFKAKLMPPQRQIVRQ